MTDTTRQSLEKPDMSNRAGQFNMPQTFTANFGQDDFHAAFFTNDAFVLHALVLAAVALVVL